MVQIFFEGSYGRIGVPLFFLLSGFLFFGGTNNFTFDFWKNKIKKRIYSLLIPYLLWNLIAYLVYLLNNEFSLIEFIKAFWVTDVHKSGSSPMDGPLWYVRNLFLMMLIGSPIVYMLVKKTSWYTFPLMLIMWMFEISVFGRGVGIAFFWFSVGSYFSLKHIDFIENLKYGNLALVVFIITAIIRQLYFGEYVYICKNIGVIAGMIALLWLTKLFVMNTAIRSSFLPSATFFIYCLHDIPLPYIKQFVTELSSNLGLMGCLNLRYLTIGIIDILFCLILYYFISKITPSFSKYLTGGR